MNSTKSITEVTLKRLNISVNEDKNETMEVEESCSSSEDTASEHSDTEKKFLRAKLNLYKMNHLSTNWMLNYIGWNKGLQKLLLLL